jgi:hypothetical protein
MGNENHLFTKHSNEAFIIASTLGYGMEYLGDIIHPSTYGCKGLSYAKHYVMVIEGKG